jgi:hypothetical protein
MTQKTNIAAQVLRDICRQLRFDREAISRLESEGGRSVPRSAEGVPPALARDARIDPDSFQCDECEGEAT